MLPVDLVRGLTQVVRGLAELPLALERTMRETNALIAESRAQLELLREQAGRMMAQLEKMTAVADRLVEGTAPMAAMAEEARREMTAREHRTHEDGHEEAPREHRRQRRRDLAVRHPRRDRVREEHRDADAGEDAEGGSRDVVVQPHAGHAEPPVERRGEDENEPQ